MPTLEELIQRCRDVGLRKTFMLRMILAKMLERKRPISVQQLLETEGVAENCNPATCYRLLTRLEEYQIIRRIGTHARAVHYVLNLPGFHHDYLICERCGKVEMIEEDCPVGNLERTIAANTGFSGLYHELIFFGTCPNCG